MENFFVVIVLIVLCFFGFTIYFFFKSLEFVINATRLYRRMIDRQDLTIKLLLDIRDDTKLFEAAIETALPREHSKSRKTNRGVSIVTKRGESHRFTLKAAPWIADQLRKFAESAPTPFESEDRERVLYQQPGTLHREAGDATGMVTLSQKKFVFKGNDVRLELFPSDIAEVQE